MNGSTPHEERGRRFISTVDTIPSSEKVVSTLSVKSDESGEDLVAIFSLDVPDVV